MSLVAICPRCHQENLASNTTCDMCGAAIGSILVDTGTRAKRNHILLSALLTWGIFFIATLSPLHRAGVALTAIFYGPLLVSYWARSNVVWESGLGGVLGIGLGLLSLIVLAKDSLEAMLITVGDAGPGEVLALVLVALLVLLPLLLPFSLMGAAVGETLAARKRNKNPLESPNLDEVDPASIKL